MAGVRAARAVVRPASTSTATVPTRAAITSTGSARAGTRGSSRARSAADRLAVGGRALERDSGLAPQVVERGLEQHQDLGDGVERERLEPGSERAQPRDGGGPAVARVTSGSRGDSTMRAV
jgi:hypothetical protein